MSNYFYVYAYLRQLDDSPYYIGKGQRGRAYDKRHNVAVPKDKNQIIFLEENLTDEEALELEKVYIAFFGRKENGGILYNRTDGGQGVSGTKRPDLVERNKQGLSEETIRKIVASRGPQAGNNNPMFGRKHSDSALQKMIDKKMGPNNPRFGVPMSEEHKRKIGEARKRAWDKSKGVIS